ncbi:hypothetical protein OHA21_14245 [Actinoplanes sp. NBC_00393]|uniref:hypothetical protein n=1 Tax=Actinoplanes sp. NBC_00393 TaxID=2975953 RepID=UPI002E214153
MTDDREPLLPVQRAREAPAGADPAEAMAQWALGHWSLPDFLFRGRLLIVGGRGVMIAAGGSVRELERRFEALLLSSHRFVNERGRALEIDPGALVWSGLLIADDLPAGFDQAPATGNLPLLYLLRSDWEFLLHELRSASAVVRYLDWCREPGPATDVSAHHAWLMLASSRHPRQPAAPDVPLPPKPLLRDDLPGHAVIGQLLEYVATAPLPESLGETVRHRLLSLVDEFPVEARAELGRWVAEAVRSPGSRMRTFRFSGGTPQYVLAMLPQPGESPAFDDAVQVRHHRGREVAVEPSSLVTFGFVLALDETRSLVVAQFTCVQGPVSLNAASLAAAEEVWPTIHPRMP